MKTGIIKKESKTIIKGKRRQALSIVLFNLFFCAAMTALSYGIIILADRFSAVGLPVGITVAVILVIISLVTLCVYSSVSVGEKAWYNGVTANKANYSRRLFFWFRPKNSFRALRFHFSLFFIKLSLAILFFLPCIILIWSIYYLSGTGGLELYLFISLAAGSLIFGISGLIFYFVAVQRYFIAEYLFSSDPRLGVFTAINQSKNLLDGHIFEIVKFKLSFWPWFFGCLAVIPAFYFIPYYKESCCVVAKRITL